MSNKGIWVILIIVVSILLLKPSLNFLSVVADSHKCTSEQVTYAGTSWNIEGCPLGSTKQLVESRESNYVQGYKIENAHLIVDSKTAAEDRTLYPIEITTSTELSETKDVSFSYQLMTKIGESTLHVYNNGQLVYFAVKPEWKPDDYGESGESGVLSREPGTYQCSSCNPLGCQYGRFNKPHCYSLNQPISGEQVIRMQPGKIEFKMTTVAQEATVATGHLDIFTQEPIVIPTPTPLPTPQPSPEPEPEPIPEPLPAKRGIINYLLEAWESLKVFVNSLIP